MSHTVRFRILQLFCRLLPGVLLLLFVGDARESRSAQQCPAVTISFSLKAGESFQQEIGNDLVFLVRADTSRERPNGWALSIDNAAGRDVIAPVNPPIRFNPSQILGPGYGLTAKDSLKNDRELHFLISDSDYEFVAPLWQDALWPYNAPAPGKTAENYTGALARIPLGVLRLRTVQADISPEDFIRSATFEAEFVSPAQFQFSPSLSPRPSACPPPFKP
jgi:hypothetical protein